MTKRVRIGLMLLGVLLILISLLSARLAPSVQAQGVDPQDTSGMAPPLEDPSVQFGLSPGAVNVRYHAQTGLARFIGTSPGESIPQPSALPPDGDSETAARNFLGFYGKMFGLAEPQSELQAMQVEEADGGRSFVRFQQVYQGVPVVGGELIVQLDSQKDVLSVSGEALPRLDLSPTPQVSSDEATQTALALVGKQYGLASEVLVASQPELWIYNPVLLGAPGIPKDSLVWRLEVTTVDLQPVRELVLVDAQNGTPALNFNQIDNALYRVIYDNNNNYNAGLPGTGPIYLEQPSDPTGSSDAELAYVYSGNTYNFYFNSHGRDSLDGVGNDLISTVRYCPDSSHCPYANAFWNGVQMVYGSGFAAADDVVGHELTHGVTDNESNLFYYMQSGAINESFSDIWGEFVDLQYNENYDNDEPGVRWLIGEDLPCEGIPCSGTVRSMSNPPDYNQPDRIGSPNYVCANSDPYNDDENDNGGVHTNSGVGNKAAFLMVDGGSFNGFSIPPGGIGMTKTARIFYEAQTHLLTSASDYQDLAEALSQACNVLVGTSGITSEDCLNVRKAIAATEMANKPASCAANEAPVCDNFGFTSEFNSSMDGWTATNGSWSPGASFVSTAGSENSFTSLEHENNLTDFTFTATMHRYGDCLSCANGIVIRGSPLPFQLENRWNKSYDFYYSNNGLVSVVKRTGFIEEYLLNWTPLGAVVTGEDNTLQVVARGNTFYFYVNGKLAWLGHDDDYTAGKVGLIMYRDESSGNLQVDRAELKGGSPIYLFNDSFEYGLENWTHGAISGSDQWYHDAYYASAGEYELYGDDQPAAADYFARFTNPLSVPSGVNTYLRFRHAFDMEGTSPGFFYDGGVIEYSTNDGANWSDAASGPSSLLSENGYTESIANGFSNPLSGRNAYVGDSDGYISTRLNLSSLAGNSFLFRFRMGTDGRPLNVADLGWLIDEVQVYTCHEQVAHAYLPLTTRLPEVNSFDYQFTNSRSGWRPISGLWTVNVGEFSTPGTPLTFASASNLQEFADLDYSVRLKRRGTDHCLWCANQIIIRGAPEPMGSFHLWNSAYLFQYSDDGWYSIWKIVNGVFTSLIPYPNEWQETDAINQGGYNVLRVVATGSSLNYYINGTLVWSGSDSSFTKGTVGFGMYQDMTISNDWLDVDYATLTGGTTVLADGQIVPLQQGLNDDAINNPVGDITGSPRR